MIDSESSLIMDPENCYSLEEFLLFSIVVAGKSSRTQLAALKRFLEPYADTSPFAVVRFLRDNDLLLSELQRARLGQYGRLEKCFSRICDVDPETVTLEELEAIPGIGPKTARFFLLHSREGLRYAVLDTHILKFIRAELGLMAPKATPTGKKYKELEDAFLRCADTMGMSPAELDIRIWRSYARGN